MFSRFIRRSHGVAAAVGLSVLLAYIFRHHPIPHHDPPDCELCCLVMVDAARLYDEVADRVPAMEELLDEITRRRPRVRVGVAVPDAARSGLFEELRSPLYDKKLDREERVKLRNKLRHYREDLGPAAGSGVFVPDALDWARRRLDRAATELPLCQRWELLVLTTGEALEVPPDVAARLPHRLNSFCPTTTRVVLLPDLAQVPDAEGLQPLAERIRQVAPHCLWSDLEEYRALQELTRHLIFVDISGSVRERERNERSVIEWFDAVYSRSILPAVQARMPIYPDQDLEVSIFGSRIVKVQESKSAPVMTTPRLMSQDVREANPRQTSLAGLFEHLEKEVPEAASVWLYTDGVDAPLPGEATLADKLAEWSCDGTPPPWGGKWLYLQLPAGVDGVDDPDVRRARQAAECLGFQVVGVSGPPSIETLVACRP